MHVRIVFRVSRAIWLNHYKLYNMIKQYTEMMTPLHLYVYINTVEFCVTDVFYFPNTFLFNLCQIEESEMKSH